MCSTTSLMTLALVMFAQLVGVQPAEYVIDPAWSAG